MKISVIGSGYVGLVTGACFAHLGHQVLCVDNNQSKINQLKKGLSPIYEPGLVPILKKSIRKKTLSFSTKISDAVKQSEVIFICVGTPTKDNGDADLSAIENVAREIAKNMKSYCLIVEKSTVPVQTGEWIYKTVKNIQSDERLFDVASNPEFLREGSAVDDFLKPDRIIFGVANERSEKILRKLYEPIHVPILVTDIKSAEMIKHASNSYLATKISFINGVAKICDATGADIDQVARGMGLDPRISPQFLKAGIGFGGFCFPKDLAAFYSISEKMGSSFGLLREALEINEQQKKFFIKKIESHLWNLKNKTLGVLGISFKPDTDDIRYAPALDIIRSLHEQGAHIRAYDPQAMPNAKKVLSHVKWTRNAYEACRNADAMLLLTEWKEFLDLDFSKIKKLLQNPIVFDGRNALDAGKILKSGLQYIGIGRHPMGV